jgi:chromosome segregation ATPase
MQMKQTVEQSQHQLESKHKENQQLTSDFNEMKKKLMEYEYTLNQRVEDTNVLTNKLNQQKSEYNVALKKYQDIVAQFELQFKNLNKDLEYEKEQGALAQKRLRDELITKQNDVDTLRTRAKLYEEKEKTYLMSIEEFNRKLTESSERFDLTTQQHTELKEKYDKLSEEYMKTMKLNEDLYNQVKTVKEYNQKFEEHYNKKKKVFECAESQNKDLKMRIDHYEKELNSSTELKHKLNQSETRVRSLTEEYNYLKEKLKTVSFENQQLKSQKEDLAKKMTDMPLLDSRESLLFIKPKGASGIYSEFLHSQFYFSLLR